MTIQNSTSSSQNSTSSGSKFAACNATSFTIADKKKTKIVATVGPASRSPENLRSLILAGVDVFRLNFSHGSYQEHKENLDNIRQISNELSRTVGVLQDLAGPKIRITPLREGNPQLEDNKHVELHLASNFSEAEKLSSPLKILVESVDPVKVCRAGDRVLLADGIICLEVTEVHHKHVLCNVVKGGRLRSRVGIAFPDGVVDLPATTDKDLKDFAWGIENKVDFVAISFVQTAEDLLRLRRVMAENSANIQIISKIERKVALDNLESILDQSDGVMVARGDLGLELPLEQVPHAQRALIKASNKRGIPVIVATQMLSSMVTSIRPTRAEATDVAFAVLSGADAVMLSEETAIGEHPAECVKYLAKIAVEAESHPTMAEPRADSQQADLRMPIPDAIAFAACAAASKVGAKAIIACTTSGTSARLVSKYRPSHPIFAVSTVEESLRRMSLCWGVIPMKVSIPADPKDEISGALLAVQKYARFEPRSLAVITGSGIIQTVGATNVLEVQEIPAVF